MAFEVVLLHVFSHIAFRRNRFVDPPQPEYMNGTHSPRVEL